MAHPLPSCGRGLACEHFPSTIGLATRVRSSGAGRSCGSTAFCRWQVGHVAGCRGSWSAPKKSIHAAGRGCPVAGRRPEQARFDAWRQPSRSDGSLCKGTAPFMPLQPKVLEPWGTLFSTRLTGFRGTWPAGKWPPSSCPDFGLNQQKYPQNERKPPRQAGAVGSRGCVSADETEFRLGFVGGPSRPPARSAPPHREPARRT